MNDRKKPGTSEIVTARRGADGEWTGHPDAVREAIASVKAASERARRWPQTPEGYVDTCAAMTVLARSFPVIARDADGIAPWDVDRFLFWLCGPAPSSGALHAGRFLLSVWNPSTDWIEQAREKGIDGAGAAKRFDLFDAVRRLGRCARVCVHGLDRSAVLAVVGVAAPVARKFTLRILSRP
jgi:hypothetical protein